MKKLLFLVASMTLLLAACNGTGGKEVVKEREDEEVVVVEGERLVNKSCITCHGDNLEGQGAATTLLGLKDKYSQEELEDIIKNGKGNMPGNLVEGENVQVLAEWLLEQEKEGSKEEKEDNEKEVGEGETNETK